MLFERALKHIPGSYKLWRAYLMERRKQIRKKCITDPAFVAANDVHERALVFMHKMPRIWVEYLEFLVMQRKATQARRTFDRALQGLPVTQHERIWPLYINFVEDLGVWETAVRVYRRFLKFDAGEREKYVEYLHKIGHFDEAAVQLATVVNDPDFVSKMGKSRHELWMELCDIISQNPGDIKSLQVEPILRSGIRHFTDEVGRLWCALADYYIRLGQFERARDMYEEALDKVMTVRDFSMVYDAYVQFEDTMITAKMEMMGDDEEDEEEEEEAKTDGDDDDLINLAELAEEGNDIDLRFARLEHLMARRPELLSSVLLRQNPHNVHEWHKRVKLYPDDPAKAIRTYTQAVGTVDPQKAVGKPHTLWAAFAKFYEEHEDLENAAVVFRKATEVSYRGVDDLASIWCEWIEMYLRHEMYDEALARAQEAVREPVGRAAAQRLTKQKGLVDRPVQERLHRSTKLWCLYCDLEESLGTLKTASSAYDRAMELKVATPQMVINYADMLDQNKYWEQSFKVFERGIAMFDFPHVQEIWLQYLWKFIQRYGGRKIERARDLCEQALAKVPAEDSKLFYLMYAKLEEEHGLIRHTMGIFDRATKTVPPAQKNEVYLLYLAKVEEYYGAMAQREVYERAIDMLPDEQVRDMCLRYANLETKLGCIDRARALYTHCSQFCDPRTVVSFWKDWEDFEIAHGNSDTFTDMRRVQRSVQAKYSNVNYQAAEMISEMPGVTTDAEATQRGGARALMAAENNQEYEAGRQGGAQRRGADPSQAMAHLEKQAAAAQAATGGGGGSAAPAANPEEIDLDEDEEDEEEDNVVVDVQEKTVPASLFGGDDSVLTKLRADQSAQAAAEAAVPSSKKQRTG